MKRIRFITIAIIIFVSTSNINAQTTDTFKDSRDGKTYKTVKIGEQVWMAENLAFKTKSGSLVFENNENTVDIYGRYYEWETAKNACPGNWHLPTDAEWTSMINYLGGEKIAGQKLKGLVSWFDNHSTTQYGTKWFQCFICRHLQ